MSDAPGQRALVLQTDTTEEHSVIELFDQAQAFGTLTGLVNNAGSASAIGSLEGNSLKAISRDLDVNLLGVIACSKYAIGPLSQAGGGCIVNISSAAATLGGPGTYVHYAAAKAAVEALTVGLSKELAGKNIRVNAVAPGTVWTDFHQDRDRPAKVAAAIPMGRAGSPTRSRERLPGFSPTMQVRHRHNDPSRRRALTRAEDGERLRAGTFV